MKTWKFTRHKDRILVASVVYRFAKLLPFSRQRKFALFSNLAWIFRRITFEQGGSLHNISVYELNTLKFKFIQTEIKANDIILDLGCAEGFMANRISTFSKHVVGVDYNPELISNAIKAYENTNVDFVCQEALSYLATTETSFDVMICSHIIEHLDEPILFLKEYLVYFKKIFIEVPDNDQDEHNHLRVACGLQPLYNDADHIYEFKRNDMFRIFEQLKLTIISSEYCYGVMRFWLKCPNDES